MLQNFKKIENKNTRNLIQEVPYSVIFLKKNVESETHKNIP